MIKKSFILSNFTKCSAIIGAVLVVTQCVFAITGIRLTAGGEDKGKDARTTSFSNIKKDVNFSLKDNYGLSSKNTFVNARKATPVANSETAPVSYKKGNTVYILPYKKNTGVKLPNFISITPQATPNR